VEACVHPAVTGAVAVLAVNDQVLKRLVPCWWTGKLSDVAGVFVVAALLGVVVRPRLAALVTAGGFAAIKLSAAAAGVPAPLLGGRTGQDPTDLLALVAVVPAYRLARRLSPPGEAPWGRVTVGVVSLGMVLVTVTGTSCAVPPGVDGFVVEAGRVFARVSHGPYSIEGQPLGAAEWAVSSDGGQRWVRSGAPQGAVSTAKMACGVGRCWRVVLGRSVEEEVGLGRWREVFAFTAGELAAMRRRDDSCGRIGDQFGAVAVAETAGGVHAVVAMGSQGSLHGRPDGTWSRRPVLDRTPTRSDGAVWVGRLVGAPLVVAVLVPVLFLVGRRQNHPRRGGRAASVAAAGGAAGFALAVTEFFGADFTAVGPAVGGVCVVVFVVSLVLALRPSAEPESLHDPRHRGLSRRHQGRS
jgi:hypothetical protein